MAGQLEKMGISGNDMYRDTRQIIEDTKGTEVETNQASPIK